MTERFTAKAFALLCVLLLGFALWTPVTSAADTSSEAPRPGIPSAPARVGATTIVKVTGRSAAASSPANREVRLLAYRSVSGVWRHYATVPTSISAGATYTASVRLPYAGAWRLIAQQIDHAAATTSTSNPRSLTVVVTPALTYVRALSANGSRTPSSRADMLARRYIAAKLASWGYSVRQTTVYLPDGHRTANVIAEKRGASTRVIVVGAHRDSKRGSPGANDNASGCAGTLELARRFATANAQPTIRFIFFGAEEVVGSKSNWHHFGSRQYVRSLTPAAKARIVGMIDLDMIGVGTKLYTRNLGVAPRTLERSLRTRAARLGYRMTYLRDPSRTGWSDHEAFEFAGIPAAWIEWRTDYRYHTSRDTAGYCSEWRMQRVVRIVSSWLGRATDAQLKALRQS